MSDQENFQHRIERLEEENRQLRKKISRYEFLTAQSLKESEQRYRIAEKVGNFGYWVRRPENTEAEWSPQVYEIFGVSPEDFSPTWEHFLAMVHEEDRSGLIKAVDRAAKTGEKLSVDYRILRPDGGLRYVHSVAETHRDKEKEETLLIGLLFDVTRQRKVEDALYESENRYRELFHHTTDAILVYRLLPDGTAGTFTEVNDAACERLGFSRTELLQMTIADIEADPQSGRFSGKIEELRRDGTATFEARYKNRKGRIFPVEVGAHMFRIRGREWVLSIARDVTERKALEVRLRRSQKMEAIGTLAGGIAHDFNNILATIIGFAELSLDEAPEGSDLYDNLREVLLSGRRARDLVRQILSFSRRTDKAKGPVRINPLVKETVKMLRATLPSSVEVWERVCRESLSVLADPTQIQQIIINLATNAADAMFEEGGRLDIGLEKIDPEVPPKDLDGPMPGGRYLLLTVSDTGIGIEPEDLERIFDPYFTKKPAGKGSGLGLSVAHGIVSGCGGQIAVQSRPGKGTVFRVYLPLVEEKTAFAEPGAAKKLPAGDEHVLVVDDEPSIVKMLRLLLEHLGYRVTACHGALEALEDFRRNPAAYDAVITDMTMPQMTGDRLAAKIKGIRPEVPVVLCTGYSAKIDPENAELSGIEDFLTKPLDREQIANKLRRVLDARRRV